MGYSLLYSKSIRAVPVFQSQVQVVRGRDGVRSCLHSITWQGMDLCAHREDMREREFVNRSLRQMYTEKTGFLTMTRESVRPGPSWKHSPGPLLKSQFSLGWVLCQIKLYFLPPRSLCGSSEGIPSPDFSSCCFCPRFPSIPSTRVQLALWFNGNAFSEQHTTFARQRSRIRRSPDKGVR